MLSLVHYILLSCAMTNHEPEQGFKASSVDQLVTQFLQSIRGTIRCCPWWSVRPVQRAGVQCGYRGRSGVVTRQRCCSPTCRDEPAAMVRCKQVPNQAWRPTPRRQSICTPTRTASIDHRGRSDTVPSRSQRCAGWRQPGKQQFGPGPAPRGRAAGGAGRPLIGP